MDERIVAIETSGRQGSVAVARGPSLLKVRELSPSARHAVELMPAIEELTRAQGWAPADIQHVYLSLGPGSFTGLRIAVAVARAMAQAAGCRIVGVPSLEVIAHNAPPEFAMVLPILDAKRGQVFAARYQRQARGGELVQTAPAGVVDPRQFVREAMRRAAETLTETGPINIGILGEGVDYHRAELLSDDSVAGIKRAEIDRTLWPAKATVVHQLGYAAAQRGEFSDPQTLLPIYIRLPEAEEVYRRKHGLPIT